MTSHAAVPHHPPPVVRVAAVGDLHLTAARAGRFRPALLRLRHHADLLLLAGDLTERATAEQAACLTQEVNHLGLPVVAVLGNHDHLTGGPGAARVSAALAEAGVVVLDDAALVVAVNDLRVGVAGTMGFGGGFDPAPPDDRADRFAAVLGALDCDLRIALTHYAPAVGTLDGEPGRLYPALGSAALGTAIDTTRTHLAIHGHAHHGQEHGTTPGGVPVRNVAYPVIRSEARIYHLHRQPDHTVSVTTLGHDRVGAWLRWSSNRSVDLAGQAIGHTHTVITAATTRTGKGARRG